MRLGLRRSIPKSASTHSLNCITKYTPITKSKSGSLRCNQKWPQNVSVRIDSTIIMKVQAVIKIVSTEPNCLLYYIPYHCVSAHLILKKWAKRLDKEEGSEHPPAIIIIIIMQLMADWLDWNNGCGKRIHVFFFQKRCD